MFFEYFHCGFFFHRTDVFADTASGAELLHYVRFFQNQFLTRVVRLFNFFKTYSLFRDGTVFFADYAVQFLRVRETVVLVDDCKTDHRYLLLLEGKIGYGAGRADLAAQVAIIFAVSEARDDHGREEAVEACLERGWIERISRTDLHAFPAAHAFLQELIVSGNPRGP